ncbi:MAG: ribonuclease III [Clostridia bacterium]|nr:ribonuclease III [Clostridia bacterium]
MSDIKNLEKNLGYTFKDISLLRNALVHPSYLNEKHVERIYSNQRLEFFGDSVLSLAVSEYIFKNLKSFPEGKLTELRAKVVCEESLAKMAASLDVGSYLVLGRGEIKSGGAKRPSTLSDAMEAIIAAVYLDGGFEEARKLVLTNLMEDINEFSRTGGFMVNYKSDLQELVQAKGMVLTYKVVGEDGPEHAKCFEVAAYIDGKEFSRGEGSSKKRAEQEAAKIAYQKLK